MTGAMRTSRRAMRGEVRIPHSKKAAAPATAFSIPSFRSGKADPGMREAPGPCKPQALSSSGLVEQGLDVFPVHEVLDKRLQIVGTAVAVVDVVGVLPDVAAEDRGGAVHQRILAVRGLGNLELAVLDLEPAPAGAELADAGRLEVRLELLEAAEVLVDLFLDLARQLGAAAIGLHPAPEMDVVVVLAGIVEHRGVLAERALDDLLKGLAFPFGALERVVAVGDIGLMMLVVVEFERFLRHELSEGVIGVGEWGQRKGHGCCPRLMGERDLTVTPYRRFRGR